MEFQKFADTYVVRLDKGEEIIASLQKLCETEQIALASVTGIGAADHAVIGLYDVGQRHCILICAIRKCRSWAGI